MIDKLDLRIPRRVGFTSEFDRLYSQLRSMEKSPFRPSKYYEFAGDLREYGHDARLNMFCRMHKSGDHKIELFDVGTKSKSEIIEEIARIFDFNPYRSGIMRVDFAVDVPGVSLSWFREAVRVSYKRWRAGVTNDRFFSEMGNGNIQTLYFGKRPNLIRIYDKRAEYLAAYRKLNREHRGETIPTFESIYGVPDDDSIITRIERQIGGRIPNELNTLGEVIRRARDFEPFAAFKIARQVAEPLNDSTLPFETFCTASYLRYKASRDGMQAIGPFFNQHANGNSAWAWKKYGPYLACLSESSGISSEELQALFAQSIVRQFADRKLRSDSEKLTISTEVS